MNFVQRLLRQKVESYIEQIEVLAEEYTDIVMGNNDLSVSSLAKGNELSKDDLKKYHKLQNKIFFLSIMIKD